MEVPGRAAVLSGARREPLRAGEFPTHVTYETTTIQV